jgi:L-asparaginase
MHSPNENPTENASRYPASDALPLLAEVWRGTVRECLHFGAWVETDAEGTIRQQQGDASLLTTMRSAAKPWQAVPLVTHPGFAALGMSTEEQAICCASHPGSPRHAALAASVLALSGFLPDELVCGIAGNPPSPLKHGCSGNHAAILLAAYLRGLPLVGYHLHDHPIQYELTRLFAEEAGVPGSAGSAGSRGMERVTDGCGIPTFALSLQQMARLYARLTLPTSPAAPLAAAMTAYPELVGSERSPDVCIMQMTEGAVCAKTGAEGLLCLSLTGAGRGIAVKIIDGSSRALGTVAFAAMERCGWLTETMRQHPLAATLHKPLLTTPQGETVGEIRAV